MIPSCAITGLFCLAGLLASGPARAAIVWQTGPGIRSAQLALPATGKTGFTTLNQSQTGIAFTNHLPDVLAAENQIRLIGSGVALGDVDGDGRCDIYLCRLDGPNALYRNLGGWKFEDITARAGVACAGQFSTGAALADLDGDGDLDLLVNSIGGGTRGFFNDGKGGFTETIAGGLLKKNCATSLALADVDGDGDLDLYVCNYRTTTVRSTGMKIFNVGGRRVIRPEDRDQYEFTADGFLLEHGEPDAFYLNDGKGNFTAVPWTGGHFLDEDGQRLAKSPKDWGLSVMFRDMNGDGAPDLYVCNDFWSVDRVWLNDGAGKFRAAPRLTLRGTSTFSMGVDFADVDRDGLDDFLVLDMLSRDHPRRMRQRALMGQNFANNIGKIDDRPQTERNTLFLNRGDGTYAEIAQFAGLHASEWSWAVVFLDVDFDGFEDVLITTGHGFDTQDADTDARLQARGSVAGEKFGDRLLAFPHLNVPNSAFRNRGDRTFEEVGAQWGFDTVGVAHGLALADLDLDGDLDAVVNSLNGPVGIFRNDSVAPRLAVRLKGKAPNTQGIGARINFLGGPVPQSQEVIAGGRYLSGDDPMRVFAAGNNTNSFSIEVTWRNGTRSLVTNAQPNHVYEVAQTGATVPTPHAPRPALAPHFADVSDLLGHTHHEPPFDDFARQPLLARRLSQAGPGVAWFDFDGDGREDIIIGAGRGGEPALYRNRGDGKFERAALAGAPGRATDDQTTILGWATGAGSSALLVGQANYETGDTNSPAARLHEIRAGGIAVKESFPGGVASAGPLAVADVDGDGDLDLFIGGRVVPGRYPEPAASRWFRNDGGKFQLAAEWPALGLVSGAVFSDLDGDGLPELIVACEWGPLKIFRNEQGRLSPWNPPVTGASLNSQLSTLNQLQGWWNGVTTGDFDGDGRLDIVASNWGRNHPWRDHVRDGLRLFHGDFAGRGGIDPVEAIFDSKYGRVVPWRDLDKLAASLPWVRERFTTCAAYGDASLEQILGDRLKDARNLRANWMDSTVFLNRGDRFEASPLPAEAQFAPAFATCVGDYDGDGSEDVFLSQNFFTVEEQTSRFDAGLGLWLRGDGRGNFKAVSGRESGVKVYGEQRGAALCDYDADGRLDLAVTQNGAATKLFHNAAARPGLRVRLAGPPGNPAGIGAVVRLHFGARAGAAREVHAGSGYWSQDSAVLVLAAPEAPAQISVRWPGGKTITNDVPKGAREVAVAPGGALKVTR